MWTEIDTIRSRGYAINRGKSIPGLRAIGVSICSSNEDVVRALSVSTPLNRMKKTRINTKLAPLMLGVANEMKLTLQHG